MFFHGSFTGSKINQPTMEKRRTRNMRNIPINATLGSVPVVKICVFCQQQQKSAGKKKKSAGKKKKS
jgi:hypothetical protein